MRSLMKYCSSLCVGSLPSHLAQHDAVETKAFNIIGISSNEAESTSMLLRHRRWVGGLSVFHCLLSGLAPSALFVLCLPQVNAGHTQSTINPFW